MWIVFVASFVPFWFMWRFWISPRARKIPLFIAMFLCVVGGSFHLSGTRYDELETIIRATIIACVQLLASYAVWRWVRNAPKSLDNH